MSSTLIRQLSRSLATSAKRNHFIRCSRTNHQHKTFHRCITVNSHSQKHTNVHPTARIVSQRFSHTSADASLSLEQKDDHVVARKGDRTYQCSYLWLRDHCQCSECYDVKTHQHLIDTNLIDPTIVPQTLECKEEGISIVWPDNHKTFYSWTWMEENGPGQQLSNNNTTHKMVYWDGETMERLLPADVKFEDLVSKDEALKTLLETLYTYGIAFVDEVPVTEEDTQRAIERIGAIVVEIFCGKKMWTISPGLGKADTAYTNKALGSHTDNTYFYEPAGPENAGLQVLHCLHHEGTGGENPMVDGFHAADALKHKHPEHFEALCRIPLTGRYLGDGKDLNVPYHTIKVNPITQQFEHIRFNVYDRGPLSHLSEKDIKAYYEAFRALASEIQNPSSVYQVKPQPGRLMIFDNWRVLHGRKGFTGKRIMTGCYVSRMEYLNSLQTVADIRL